MNNIPFRSDQVVDELVQFNQNLSKGVKNLLDADEISAGVTPREEIYAEDKLKLYRYQPSAGVVQNKIPTLIVYALVNRPYMADIQENRSTIRGLLDTGQDVYLIDWGYPDRADKYLTQQGRKRAETRSLLPYSIRYLRSTLTSRLLSRPANT